MSDKAIADHALLSDRHSSALVDRSGSVEWLSLPRFDSPSAFGQLPGEGAGHRSITPTGDWMIVRRYVDRTLVLETTFTTATSPGADRSARTWTQQWRTSARHPHLLVLRLACTSGSAEVTISYAPRPEYGLVVPLLAHVDGRVSARAPREGRGRRG